MRIRFVVTVASVLFITPFVKLTHSQELGISQTYGENGRLFSSGDDDYFLLSRQTYATDDSSGYQGQIRVVKKYSGGGYEIKTRDYIARCNAPFDHMVQIIWSEPGEDTNPRYVPIKNPGKFPGRAIKDSYNLYWAACHDQFRKFK